MADTAPQGNILNDDKPTWEAFEAYLLNKIDDIDLVPQPTPANIQLRATGKYGNSISKVTRDVRDWIHGDAVGGLLDGIVRLRGGILLRDQTLLRTGAGDPEGNVVAAVGSQYLRSDAPTANTLLYLKISGVGNTGWQAADIGAGAGGTWAAALALGAGSGGVGDNPTIDDGDVLILGTGGGNPQQRFNTQGVGGQTQTTYQIAGTTTWEDRRDGATGRWQMRRFSGGVFQDNVIACDPSLGDISMSQRLFVTGAIAANAAASADDQIIGAGGGISVGQTFNSGANGNASVRINNGTNLEDGGWRYFGSTGNEFWTFRARNRDVLTLTDTAVYPEPPAEDVSLGLTNRGWLSMYLKDGVTAPGTPITGAVFYVDAADGDPKMKFSDGVVAVLNVGYTLSWGAELATVARNARGHGRAANPEFPLFDEATELTVPRAGTMNRLSWNTSAADATTVIKIHVNQVVVETIILGGLVGTAALSAAVALGDQIAIEYDAGTAPSNSVFEVYIV